MILTAQPGLGGVASLAALGIACLNDAAGGN